MIISPANYLSLSLRFSLSACKLALSIAAQRNALADRYNDGVEGGRGRYNSGHPHSVIREFAAMYVAGNLARLKGRRGLTEMARK